MFPLWSHYSRSLLNFNSYVGSSATDIAYGMKVAKKNDPYLENAEQVSDGLMQAIYPGRFLVEAFPLMKYIPAWFPGAEFQRLAAKWSVDAHTMVDVPFDKLKQDREVPWSLFLVL